MDEFADMVKIEEYLDITAKLVVAITKQLEEYINSNKLPSTVSFTVRSKGSFVSALSNPSKTAIPPQIQTTPIQSLPQTDLETINNSIVKMVSTIDALESDSIVKEDFMTFYERMKTHMVIGDTHITHGAFTKSYWTDNVDEKAQNRARLYGEIDKSKPFVEWKGQQYPARTYAWVDAIPNGKTVIVGHDRSPFHEVPAFESNINEVVQHTNDLGGTVIFTDTGAGKGGFVSGVVLDADGSFVEVVHFD